RRVWRRNGGVWYQRRGIDRRAFSVRHDKARLPRRWRQLPHITGPAPPPPPGTVAFTVAYGINGAGQVVGSFGFGTNAADSHGFLDTGGSFSQLDVPGGFGTAARGINDAGQIVGDFQDSTTMHGFLDVGGSFTTIDVPGARSTSAQGINDAGQIVGYFIDSTGDHGFLDTGGSFTI